MERRKQQVLNLVSIIVFLASLAGISIFWMRAYQQTAFTHVSKFCEIYVEENPEAEKQVLAAVKTYDALSAQEKSGSQFLAQYGYGRNAFFAGIPTKTLVLTAVLSIVAACGFFCSMGYAKQQNRRRIAELTHYLEQVNRGAAGTVLQTKEDAFSRLQDELYKTVTSLYQTRETALQAKENFADNLANIAHQLKTPITAAFLSLQLMEKTSPNPYGGQIERQLERLNRLEESLLTLSKIDAGTLRLEREPVDLYTVLCLAAENLNDLLAKEQISVEIPDRGSMQVCGDMEWMMEALMNLMKNCMEHSEPGGTVHCDYSENPLYAEMRIWDDGKGFAPEDLPHLFERFYRGKDAAGNGSGIGLALAHAIFELQSGNLTARNLPSGGACFEIRLYRH